MNDNWRDATERLLHCLTALDDETVLVIEPPGGYRWSQVLRRERMFVAEVQSNEYLAGTGLEWTPDQHDILLKGGWRIPQITAQAADAKLPGSPNYASEFGFEEIVDLATALIHLYRDVVKISEDQILLASNRQLTLDLLSGQRPRAGVGALSDGAASRPAAGASIPAFGTTQVICPGCRWKGIGRESAIRETFAEGAELACPVCEYYFGFATFPIGGASLTRPPVES